MSESFPFTQQPSPPAPYFAPNSPLSLPLFLSDIHSAYITAIEFITHEIKEAFALQGTQEELLTAEAQSALLTQQYRQALHAEETARHALTTAEALLSGSEAHLHHTRIEASTTSPTNTGLTTMTKIARKKRHLRLQRIQLMTQDKAKEGQCQGLKLTKMTEKTNRVKDEQHHLRNPTKRKEISATLFSNQMSPMNLMDPMNQ